MKFTSITLGLALCASFACAESHVPPVMTRPWEVIKGEVQPRCPVLISADKDGMRAFKVTSDHAKLSLSDEYACFGHRSYRLDIKKAGEFFLELRKPLVFEKAGEVEGFEFWIIGALNGTFVDQRILCVDGEGKEFMLIPSNASYWGGTCWWANTIAMLPYDVKFPVTVKALRFKVPEKGVGNFLHFDTFGAFKRDDISSLPDTTNWQPFPHDPKGLTPRHQDANAKVEVVKAADGKSYTFSCSDKEGKVVYTYTPKSGTLSDITCSVDGKAAFYPAQNGGLRAKVLGTEFAPADPEIKATLRSTVFYNGKLRTFWRWEKHGRKLDFELSFTLDHRTLTTEVRSESLSVLSVDAGYADKVANPRLFTLANLSNDRDAMQLLATDDYLMSVFFDWYYSAASALIDEKPYRIESHGSPRMEGAPELAKVMDADSARLTGGALYMPKTNGYRNAPYERIRITVAPSVESVMPRIPNPRSKFYEDTRQLIYMTRSYSIGIERSMDDELKFMRHLHAYGARDMFVRYHTESSHIPAANFHRLSRTFDGSPDMGGKEGFRRFVQEMRKLFKRVGPYDNHMAITGLSPEFRYDNFTICPYNTLTWQLRMKPAAMVDIHRKFSPAYAQYYGWNATYTDQLSAIPPWRLTDYDYKAPGAARFSEALRNGCFLGDEMGQHYNGPCWSEGQSNHYYAGYIDTGYNQTCRPEQITLVDYSLRELNSRMRPNGYDLFNSKANIDFMLSAEISLGSMGHIWDGHDGHSSWGGFRWKLPAWRNMLKSYFMLRMQQEFVSAGMPDKILYNIDGKFYTAGELLRKNLKNSGLIYTTYPNGTQVWANRNKELSWTIDFNGKKLVLPPFGYATLAADGKLTEYSGITSPNAHRVDYAKGEKYVYVDGRDTRSVFPEITCAMSYLLEKRNNNMTLTPTPFIKAETVEGLKQYTQAIPLDVEGKVIGEAAAIKDGKLTIDGKAFSYILK
ncbi:MAG: hypothetical protein E7056_09330 [Lentisphaerae bacterium]|nr:hypothetical protein [Lentisphaerota bacterium]